MNTHPFGIDIGGSGIKGAFVDLQQGVFASERLRIDTPEDSTPANVASVVEQLVTEAEVGEDAPVGLTVPGVVTHGTVRSAANIDKSWIGADAGALFGRVLNRTVVLMNDADAAGLAEARFGAAKGVDGLVVVTTLGTGIGSALVYDGVLVPNSELGHLEIDGHDAESRAANSIRERKDLSWEDWADRLTTYYRVVERLFSPDLIVVGGGVSKHAGKFLPLIEVRTPLVPATLKNTAGIVGAALLAREHQRS